MLVNIVRGEDLMRGLACAASAVGFVAGACGDTAVLSPSKDNTLIQIADGSLSQGSSEFFYVGRVGSNGGGTIRRGLVAFDIAAAVPAGSTINSVSLQMLCNLTNTGNQVIRLKRTLADWGEGASIGFGGQGVPAEPGDATWLHRYWPDQFWATPGGEFTAVITAQTTVGASGFYTWGPTAQMRIDVQGWLDNPAANFGWLVQGNEATLKTTKQFASSENRVREFLPALTIDYTPPVVATPGDLNGDAMVDGSDLGLLLAAWGDCAVSGPCLGDLNADAVVDGADLGMVLANWSSEG